MARADQTDVFLILCFARSSEFER